MKKCWYNQDRIELLLKGQVMKNTSRSLVVFIILILLGSPQTQQNTAAETSKRDRLLADENISLTRELAQCRSEMEKQKKLLEQYQQENKKITQKAVNDTNTIRNLENELSKCRNELINQGKQLEQCQQMVDLKDVPLLCRDKVEKVKKQLEQCRRENERIQTEAGETSEFLMKQLPADLTKQVEQLSQENEQLKARIEELEKAQKDANEVQEKQ
jgi:DNA repair exonuclease SbcCD ATPase subunit